MGGGVAGPSAGVGHHHHYLLPRPVLVVSPRIGDGRRHLVGDVVAATTPDQLHYQDSALRRHQEGAHLLGEGAGEEQEISENIEVGEGE